MQIDNIGIQMLNTGIQLINIGIKIPDINNNNSYLKQQFQNIIMEIQNLIMQLDNQFSNIGMYNMGMPLPKMNLQMNNTNFSETFIKNNEKEKYNEKKYKEKQNVCFQTMDGRKMHLVFDYGTTVNEMLKIFLIKIGRKELINNNEKVFLFNAKKINVTDNTPIEEFFKTSNPIILVQFY